MSSPTVFISYSHKDEAWKDRVCSHLGVLVQQGLVATLDVRCSMLGVRYFVNSKYETLH